ncbi:hypothetical protein SBA4_6330021 [Candidatus Sulfopaludibacter sp. SbA4]|nr:hypothetical protein SBA4_6330021 [Candidatus Sulfopaludibacter sp. SbA4]
MQPHDYKRAICAEESLGKAGVLRRSSRGSAGIDLRDATGRRPKLTTVVAQAAYAATNSGIVNFPLPPSKSRPIGFPPVLWLRPSICANNKPAGVYVETIDSTCYALVGLHLSSKLLPNWLWATFEPQNKDTNRNRCNPNLYDSCNDPWGSNPATSTGRLHEGGQGRGGGFCRLRKKADSTWELVRRVQRGCAAAQGVVHDVSLAGDDLGRSSADTDKDAVS